MTRFMVALVIGTFVLNCYGIYKIKNINSNQGNPNIEQINIGDKIGHGGELMSVSK